MSHRSINAGHAQGAGKRAVPGLFALALAGSLIAGCGKPAPTGEVFHMADLAKHPLPRQEVIRIYTVIARRLCAMPDIQERGHFTEAECMANIEKAKPICEPELAKALPDLASDPVATRAVGKKYVHCVLP